MKKTGFTVALMVLFSLPLVAQTGQVIKLTPLEANTASSLFAQKAALDAKIDQFKQEVSDKHKKEFQKSDFWLLGFIFDSSFGFIVPDFDSLAASQHACPSSILQYVQPAKMNNARF